MSRYNNYYDYFPKYVSAAEIKQRTEKMANRISGNNIELKPVKIEGSKIAKTFWGKAWCNNIESYQDYSNRLPRGRTYVRGGAVIDLKIEPGMISALVAGSASKPYEIKIQIEPLEHKRFEELKKKCTGKISSLLSLIQGKLPHEIIEEFCKHDTGLFPSPKEIKMYCSCPDSAKLCKHLAAVLYGIGARLDENPKLFFILRGIDENEFIGAKALDSLTSSVSSEIAPESVSAVFGVEFDSIEDFSAKDSSKITNPKIKSRKSESEKKKAVKEKPAKKSKLKRKFQKRYNH